MIMHKRRRLTIPTLILTAICAAHVCAAPGDTPAPKSGAAAYETIAVQDVSAAATTEGDKVYALSSEQNANALLATDLWRENAYGLSLRPPLGSHLVNQTVDEAVLRIIGADRDYAITIFVKKSPNPIEITGLQRLALDNIAVAQPTARVLQQRSDLVIGDTKNPKPGSIHTAGLAYFFIPAVKATAKAPAIPDMTLGEAYMRIDGTLFVHLRMETQYSKFAENRKIFEAMLRTLRVEDPTDLKARRLAAAKAGEEWRDKITFNEVKSVIVPEQFYRVVDKDKDVGWMQVTQKVGTDPSLKLAGASVHVRFRFESLDASYDTVSDFFVSDDLRLETWLIETVAMSKTPTDKKARGTPASQRQKWSETGKRDMEREGGREKHKITVVRKSPLGETKTFNWDLPMRDSEASKDKAEPVKFYPRPYVSQVELYLLDNLIPRRKPMEISYYAYSPNIGKLAFRTERVTVDKNGGAKVYSAPAPDQAEQVSVFDTNGRLVRRELPGGQQLIPSTEAEIKSKWSGKE